MTFLIRNNTRNTSVYNKTITLPAGCFIMCARISPMLITNIDTTLPIIRRSGNLLANKLDVTTGNISKLEINNTPQYYVRQ